MGIEKKNKSKKGFGHGTAVTRNPGQCLLKGFTKEAGERFEDIF